MTTPARREAARKTVRYLRQQASRDAPRLPPFPEILELGEAYLAEVGDGTEAAFRRTLGETGQVYVTLAASRAYGAIERLGDEEARRELTEMLLDAKESETTPGQWRFRRRSEAIDITARVSKDNQLLVVTTVSVRPLNSSRGRRG